MAILLSLYYVFIWSPYKSNGNYTRTFINSEILLIEKTNYYDVDLASLEHPHVIGQQPNAIHLIKTPTKVINLNQTESKIVLPLAVDESIERFGSTNGGSSGTIINNSEESDASTGSINSNNIGITSLNGVSANRQSYETLHLVQTRTSLPIALALKKKPIDESNRFRNSIDSDQTDYSGENNYQSKLINLLRQSKDRYKKVKLTKN